MIKGLITLAILATVSNSGLNMDIPSQITQGLSPQVTLNTVKDITVAGIPWVKCTTNQLTA